MDLLDYSKKAKKKKTMQMEQLQHPQYEIQWHKRRENIEKKNTFDIAFTVSDCEECKRKMC